MPGEDGGDHAAAGARRRGALCPAHRGRHARPCPRGAGPQVRPVRVYSHAIELGGAVHMVLLTRIGRGTRAQPACTAAKAFLTSSAACCRPLVFRPEHSSKLANEFLLYTDVAEVAEELGGWDAAVDEPLPAVFESQGEGSSSGKGLQPSHTACNGPIKCMVGEAVRGGGVREQ